MKRYVLGLTVTAVFSGASLAFVLLYLNPLTTGWVGLLLLALSLFFLVVSLVTLIGFVLRVWRSGKEVIYANLSTALRQGLLLGVVIVGSLILQTFRIFNVWSAMLFVAAVVLVELAFKSTDNRKARTSRYIPEPLDPNRAVRDITKKNSNQPDSEPWQHRFQKKNQ